MPSPPPPRPVSVTVTPASIEFEALADTVRLTTEVRDQNGQIMSGVRVVWASSLADVASVSAAGTVTAVGNGHASITGRAGAASGSAAVTVRQTPAAVSTVPDSLVLAALGDTSRLTAAVTDANGHAVEGASVTWTSADSSVASVDGTGLVTAIGVGSTDVTAAHDSLIASSKVEVGAASSNDREVLELLYSAWGGDNWSDRTNWLTDAPLSDWAGVRTDGAGRVDYLSLRNNNVEGRIPASIALLDRLFILDLSGNSLSGPIPAQLGRLTRLRDLVLARNELSGRVPPELGMLPGLRYLYLSGTNLEGPLPDTFGRLALDQFYFDGTYLCLPASLVAWYERVENRTDDPRRCVPVTADRDVLVAVYEATGGPDWDRRENWLSDRAINTWYGVKTNEAGHVTELFLANNNLAGSLPAELGNLAHLERLRLYRNDLRGRIPAELGKLRNVRDFSLSSNDFEGPIPPELGNLVNVDTLFLSHNRLTGHIPGELGNLASLERLALYNNQLSGPLPAEFGKLKNLKDLSFTDNQIEGPLPRAIGDMSSLESLSFSRNRVSGPLPAELGKLGSLRRISAQGNEIDGPLPAELGRLSALEELSLSRNRLSGSIPRELGNLPNLTFLSLFENALTGAIPAELGKLGKLETLLLSGNRLSGVIPPELGSLASLEDLHIARTGISGPIPPELGALPALTSLALFNNQLSGRLPAEVGNLRALETLYVSHNPGLHGLVPRSLTDLESLSDFSAFETGLCAQIDDDFQRWLSQRNTSLEECDVAEVERLALAEFFTKTDGESWTRSAGWNTGANIGTWEGITSRGGRVRSVELANNGVSGPLASEIANLTELEHMDFRDNAFNGAFPPAVASMSELSAIRLGGNGDMTGPLPFRLTELARVDVLEYDGTGLCASPSATFQDWLARIGSVVGATCGNPETVGLALPVVYLAQAIQRPTGDVPLIEGRDALLRVFLTSDVSPAFFEPDAVATFTQAGHEVHRTVMKRDGDLLATVADEDDLRNSYNAVIPGDIVRPGVELVVEADPAGVVPLAAGSSTRFPASGAHPLNVIGVPPMDLVVVPVLEATQPDSSIFEWVNNIADDSPEVGLFRHSFPFGEFRARTRESYITSLDLTDEDDQWLLVLELEAVRTLENGSGYWYGAAASKNGVVRGRARLAAWVSIGKAWDTELAHEVGHTLGLRHAPCGGALGTDPDFPYPNGSIGAFGYDFRDGTVVSPASRRDIMGYCYEQGWLSDYYYEKVIDYRERVEGEGARALVASAAPRARTLVLWGGVVGGQLRLEPVFSVTAAPQLPSAPGPYRLEGTGPGGSTEFSLSFTPGEDKFGDKYFFFAVPMEADWANTLERIALTGPEGAVTIDADDERALSVVRNARTGRIRAILRDWDGPLPAALGRIGDLDVAKIQGIADAVGPPR